MQPKSQRRVHGAELKAKILAECEQPGASVAAVALAHGLNVNLVRKWLVGRGIKRTGLPAPRTLTHAPSGGAETTAASLQFIPVEVAPVAPASEHVTGRDAPAADIHIEVVRGGTRLSVRWPCAQVDSCAAWLHELAAAALKE